MKHNLTVRSTVIDWQDQTLEITDTAGNKHTLPLLIDTSLIQQKRPYSPVERSYRDKLRELC